MHEDTPPSGKASSGSRVYVQSREGKGCSPTVVGFPEPLWDRAIDLILQGKVLIDVAHELGVGVQLLRKWRYDEGFRQLYDERRKEVLERSVNLLGHEVAAAVRQLVEEMTNPTNPNKHRITAADKILARYGDFLDRRERFEKGGPIATETSTDADVLAVLQRDAERRESESGE